MMLRRKYYAKIELLFDSDNLNEIGEKFGKMKQHIDKVFGKLCHHGIYTNPREHKTPREEATEEINNKCLELFFNFDYTIEEIQKVLTKISNELDSVINEEIMWQEADRMKDVQREARLKFLPRDFDKLKAKYNELEVEK